ncbi:hypothetical protein [Streptomyces sp. enrichment culture]|uniref:hypothetical protein n=1 Tax=Streptomyces sp. enrichment culture TaxID=1795815 RepID=UPI003F54D903
MSTYDVLCVGGPLDGHWKVVYERSFEVAEPPKIAFTADVTAAVDEPFTKHRYFVDQVAMMDFRLWVAVCEGQFRGSLERNKAILRAILQRDVAAKMGAL